MIPLGQAFSSSIVKKWITTLTGLLLVGFLIAHLAGNLLLLIPSSEAFNTYAHKLESLGSLKLVAEFGLVALFGGHIANSIALKIGHRRARGPQGYKGWRSKGAPSQSGLASLSMPITGMILLAFVVLHVRHFTFGPGVIEGYATELHGQTVRDLHRLVMETFRQPAVVGFYLFIITLLALHLRHGVWSAIHSLGLTRPRTLPTVILVGGAFGVLLALGFFVLPIAIYVRQLSG